LILDQRLRALRGVNRCRNQVSSCPCRCPSIQPWQRATSSASRCVTVSILVPFFAIFSQTPAADSWCSPSHAANPSFEANESTGRSSLGGMREPYGRRLRRDH
jgi:hypothetical protein